MLAMMINTIIPASIIWSVPSTDMEGNSTFSYHSIDEHGLSYLLCAITTFSESFNLHTTPNYLFIFCIFSLYALLYV